VVRTYHAADARRQRPPAVLLLDMMDRDTLLKRLRFRAWHRGTKEADLMVGGFFDARHAGWGAAEIAWFEALIEEQDVDIMAWAMGREAFPPRYAGPIADDLLTLDYIPVEE
jgi:antitoxin CptB